MDLHHKKGLSGVTLQPLESKNKAKILKSSKSQSLVEGLTFEKNLNESRATKKMFLMSTISPSFSKLRLRQSQTPNPIDTNQETRMRLCFKIIFRIESQ